MNVEMKEQLSALMDGEADRDATRFVLRATEADPALRGAWSRYHLARDVLRKQPVALAAEGFSVSIMARIEAEDAAAATRGGPVGRWVRYASGGAVAAAVAVVALLASGPNGNRQAPQSSEALVAKATPAVTPVTPAADIARAVNFNADPIMVQSPLVQPASATRSLPGGYGYDPRFQQQSPWRHEAFGVQRPGGYVLLVVPQGDAVQQQRPH
jgi:sigma-E factor negative regulatory protein RseA